MRKFLNVFIFLVLANTSYSQYLTQSAEGKSSIPLPLNGVGLSVDIGKTEVGIGINNYARVLKDSAKFLLGLNLSAKNSDGLANLFSSGDIVPQGDFLGFAGLSFSNNKTIIKNFNNSDAMTIDEAENQAVLKLFAELKGKTGLAILNASKNIADESKRIEIILEMQKKINSILEIAELNKYVKTYDRAGIDLKAFKVELDSAYQIHFEEYKNNFNNVRLSVSPRLDAAFDDFINRQVPFRGTIFLQGGINARAFTRFLKVTTPDFSKSFQDTLFRGGIFGLGLNLQVKNYWLGITYSYFAGDNFSSLKSKKYTIRTVDTAANQSLIREKEVTAYSGKYARVASNQLNIDLVGDFKLSDTSRLLASFYMRGLVHSRDTSYLKNVTNIGAGLYFIGNKGKFLGGLYIELPDVNNNIEKSKPENEINIRDPFKKLTFGIVTKFNLSSIFAWANRPVKPD